MKKLGCGLMRLPQKESANGNQIDIDTVCKMVDTFLERGFTYFDTAYMYHEFKSEFALRDALVRRHPRDSFTVADKMPTMFLKEQADLERIFNEQLDKCGVDYFDYYLLHNLGVENYAKAQKFNAFEFVAAKKREGKIKNVGFSFHDTADVLDEILTAHGDVDFVQLQINYLDWEDKGIQSRKCYEAAVKHGVPVIVMEPVKGGTLDNLPQEAMELLKQMNPNVSAASWAIRYAASLENVFMVLSGMSDMQQLLDNTDYMQDFKPLTEKEKQVLSQVVRILHLSENIPCTACGYCVDGCPKKIPIPKYFALYNAEKIADNKGFSTQQNYYDNLAQVSGKASDCISCKQCEKACPQHLEITKLLKSVEKVFE